MLKLAQSPEFWATVKVDVQGEDSVDRKGTLEFDARFKRLTPEEVQEVTKRAADAGSDRLMVREIVTDLRRIEDESGETPKFSEKLLDAVIDMVYPAPFLKAFYDALPKARAKN